MKMCVISPPILRTPPEDFGGMELIANFVCRGLAQRGHHITLYARSDSHVPPNGHLIGYSDEKELPELLSDDIQDKTYDVILDWTHDKHIQEAYPDAPVIALYQVMSLMGRGINPVFISHGQKKAKFNNVEGPIIHYGLDLSEYPFYDGAREGYLLYLGQVIPEKRIEWACETAIATNRPLKIFGPAWCPPEYSALLNGYQESHPDLISINGSIGGQEKIEVLQKAYALIHPVGAMGWAEAGAICILEALAVGTPIIGSDNGCIPEYLDVEPPVGFVCNSVQDMVGVVDLVRLIRPKDCRRRAEDFTMSKMAESYERLAIEVANGLRW